ncbi:rhodanese-like domain-containing protein [Fretibacter rubidus]|uniref:rhodanese-like domain-containing protein n=1 Tax=Fretibacter rubidus TaxID=570162 RepID=UPI00352A38F7
MKFGLTIIILTTLLLGCGNAGPQNVQGGIGTLRTIQSDIQTALPDLSHISRADLDAQLTSAPNTVVILDTRPAAEFNVSHIEGANRIDPDAAPQSLLSLTDVRGKDVVLYCSVGWRSSLLGQASKDALLAAGATSVRNLEGGLFGWHNDGRAVVNHDGPTHFIHPYDDKWGQLIKNTDAARYTP